MVRTRLGPALAAAALALAGGTAAPTAGQSVTVSVEHSAPTSGAGWLGIRSAVLVEVAGGLPLGEPHLRIVDVFQGGPADRAGLLRGDEIVALNGTPVSPQRFQELARRLQPGDPVSLTVVRGGERLDVPLAAAVRPGVEILVPRQLQSVLDSTRRVFLTRLDSAQQQITATISVQAPRFELRRIEADSVDGESVRNDPAVTHVRALTSDGVLEWITTGPVRDSVSSFRTWAFAGQGDGSTLKIFEDDGAPVAVVQADSVHVVARSRTPAVAAVPAAADAAPPPVRPLAPYLAGLNRVAGAEFTPLEGDLALYFQAEDGLLVTDVAQGTPAAAAGLAPGDVIVSARGRAVVSVNALRAALSVADGPAVLQVIRRGRSVEIRLPR